MKCTLAVEKLLMVSDLAAKHYHLLKQLLIEDSCQTRLSLDAYRTLVLEISLGSPLFVFEKKLRDLRNRHLIRLYLRELSGLATTEETTYDWSLFAEVVIQHAMHYCNKQLSSTFGTPCDINGNPVAFYTIALGKLGGRELNFSSDIDVIFVFSESGQTNGEKELSNYSATTCLDS